MKPTRHLVWVFYCCIATILRAENTPLDTPLQEQTEITITCEFAKNSAGQNSAFLGSAKDVQQAIGTYHYKLWLPKGYQANPKRRWPCMFVFSPSGSAGRGNMAGWLEANGFVVVMLVESKNGPWAPIAGNFLSAHDDVIKRVRIQEGSKMATGFSGGARAASSAVQSRPGFSGLILQGAGCSFDDRSSYQTSKIKGNPAMYVSMTIGESDSNRGEAGRMKGVFGAKFQAFTFKGGHDWSPPDVFQNAADWLLKQIYETGPFQPSMQAAYINRCQTFLERWEASTQPWERYQLADSAATFARSRNLLMDPSLAPSLRKVQAEMLKLRADPAVNREIAAADAWRRLEQSRDRTTLSVFEASCQQFLKQYKGTAAGDRAEKLLDAANDRGH